MESISSDLVSDIGENLTNENIEAMTKHLCIEEINVCDDYLHYDHSKIVQEIISFTEKLFDKYDECEDGEKFMQCIQENGTKLNDLGAALLVAERDDLYHEFIKPSLNDLETDGPALSGQLAPDGILVNKATSVTLIRTEENKNEYSMNTNPCGKVLIFNNQFNKTVKAQDDRNMKLEKRIGTNYDVEELRKTFEWLRFDVIVFNDYTSKDVFTELSKQASSEDNKNISCLIISILSHGNKGRFYDIEGFPVELNDIYNTFTAKMCVALAGKPKLYFIQACQGTKNTTVMFDGGTRRMKLSAKSAVYLSEHADQFAFISAYPGFKAIRDPSSGSWFIQTLCRVLQQYSETCYFHEIVKKVNNNIAIRCTKLDDDSIAAMMSTVDRLTLRKKIKFCPREPYIQYQGSNFLS